MPKVCTLACIKPHLLCSALLPCHVALQIHEPILTHSGAAELEGDFQACYAELAAVGVPINLVVCYDDVTGGGTPCTLSSSCVLCTL